MTKPAEKKIGAWWFTAADKLQHGDGRPIVLGKTHSLSGDIVLHNHALHWSRQPFDALQYAQGAILYRVHAWGDVVEENGRGGSRYRKYVERRDATEMLRRIGREWAMEVLHLWDAAPVVRDYLATGNETLRGAAHAAIRSAAHSAAQRNAWNEWHAVLAAEATTITTGNPAWNSARAAAGASARSADARGRTDAGAHEAARVAASGRFAEMVEELFKT